MTYTDLVGSPDPKKLCTVEQASKFNAIKMRVNRRIIKLSLFQTVTLDDCIRSFNDRGFGVNKCQRRIIKLSVLNISTHNNDAVLRALNIFNLREVA